ncbi:unnamed protein product [Staurois parvus]|uniref:Uncharacterized protein n=1 Tax=Staurois parvus TaxID=386267 RepID=A0ABN9GV15_9NEOB|nr:unnamed protein product [Staurois parvus]
MGLLGIPEAAQRVRAIKLPVRRLFRLMDGSTTVYDLLRTHGITRISALHLQSQR